MKIGITIHKLMTSDVYIQDSAQKINRTSIGYLRIELHRRYFHNQVINTYLVECKLDHRSSSQAHYYSKSANPY